MSDKPLVQQRLASDLSSLMLSIEPVNDGSTEGIDSKTNAGLDFIAGFWEALVREWTGIDRLRYVPTRIVSPYSRFQTIADAEPWNDEQDGQILHADPSMAERYFPSPRPFRVVTRGYEAIQRDLDGCYRRTIVVRRLEV